MKLTVEDLRKLKEDGKLINFVDIDGTICTDTYGCYEEAKPLKKRIKKLNSFYEDDQIVIYYTARGSLTGEDWKELTKKQLDEWGVKYHDIWFGKPYWDRFFDNKNYNIDWVKGKKCETCNLRKEYDRPGFMWGATCLSCDMSCYYEEDEDETTE